MNKQKLVRYLSILTIIFVFCWGLFVIYGLPFFWEDFDYFHLHQNQDRSLWTLPHTLKAMAQEFFAPHQLFQAGFSCSFDDRPYQYLINTLLSGFFKDIILFYHIWRALFFSIYTLLIFLVISDTSILLGLLAVLVYITSGEVWNLLAYTHDTGQGSQLAVLIAVVIFLRLLKIQTKPKLARLLIAYVLILSLSQYAILSKCDGRYLGIIFFITLVVFKRNQLRYHLPFLAMLVISELPILGYLMKFFSKTPFHPMNIASHNSLSFAQSFNLIAKNYIYPLMAMGKLLFVLLFLAGAVHLFNLIFRRDKVKVLKKDPQMPILRERIFLFFLLFGVIFVMMALSRSFDYGGLYSLGLSDCSFFIGPFLLFFCYYLALVYKYLKGIPHRAFLIALCIILMSGEALFFRAPRLNRFRGGWGNYFCAWANAEKYINNSSRKALVLSINQMHYLPFTFRNSTNKIERAFPPPEDSPFSDMEFIEKRFKEGSYADIFVIHDNPVNFRGKSQAVKLVNFTIIDGDSNDLFDRLKRLLNIRSRPLICVYHFRLNS